MTGFLNGAFVATNTAMAYPPGTWPSATLSLHAPQGFNGVVVHYDSPPPTGGDYGPIFVADDMNVTVVPEPSAGCLLAAGLAALAGSRRARARRVRAQPECSGCVPARVVSR